MAPRTRCDKHSVRRSGSCALQVLCKILFRLVQIRKDFHPNFLHPLLDTFHKRSCNDGSRELIIIIHNPHRKGWPSPSAVVRTLEYLLVVPSKAALSGRMKKHVRSGVQETREHLECGHQVGPKSSPLLRMKTPTLYLTLPAPSIRPQAIPPSKSRLHC